MIFFRFMHDAAKAVLIACLLWLVLPAHADQPPRELFIEVTTTSQLVHEGECDMSSFGLDDAPCLVFANPAYLWIVAFDGPADSRRVARIFKVDGETKEHVLAWCREDVCK